ncbi:VOC family protein [Streptomyces fractus]|uniref:VOC family protein n=1 Tax=Streptomyces fractus TaxID=641806 RepID=UPI003CECD602
MTAVTGGTPIWADAMFDDLEKAKAFYGDVLGWTFGESGGEEFGNYTQAQAGGHPAAGLSPKMPGMEDVPAAWTLYFAAPDASATAGKITAAGGQVMMGPMAVGPFGTMAIASDPAGVAFGLWQGGSHRGWEPPTGPPAPGMFCWAEVNTRDAAKSDAFFPAVFGFEAKKMRDKANPDMDYAVWSLPGQEMPAMGRMAMPANDSPAEVPSHINVCFSVANTDEAVEKAKSLDGKVIWAPSDSPFGRIATLQDPQGAVFKVIDVTSPVGDMPEFD